MFSKFSTDGCVNRQNTRTKLIVLGVLLLKVVWVERVSVLVRVCNANCASYQSVHTFELTNTGAKSTLLDFLFCFCRSILNGNCIASIDQFVQVNWLWGGEHGDLGHYDKLEVVGCVYKLRVNRFFRFCFEFFISFSFTS